MELNRRYNCFDVLKVTEKKLPFSGGLTEYFPPNPQLVNHGYFWVNKRPTVIYSESVFLIQYFELARNGPIGIFIA